MRLYHTTKITNIPLIMICFNAGIVKKKIKKLMRPHFSDLAHEVFKHAIQKFARLIPIMIFVNILLPSQL